MAMKIDTKKERLKKIPSEKVEEIVASYTMEGALEVTKTKEADGTWTVEVILPG